MPSVRARCELRLAMQVKRVGGRDRRHAAVAGFWNCAAGGRRDCASAFSICRAFWKSPRHSSAVPWHASPYAASAVIASSATTTRLGGGAPRSERQRQNRSCSPR
jgi:hypothetical protein